MSDNRNKNTDKNAEHILVCISSSPSNTKIIQTASSMAKAFGAMFSALYIKTPSAASLEPKDKERLLSNIHFALRYAVTIFLFKLRNMHVFQVLQK